MGKSSPKQPAAPDPVATAKAQEAQNIGSATAQANLNRINQYTPQGSLTYQQIGTNADGTPQYQQTQTYSAPEQQKYDLNNQVAISLDKLANDNVGQVQQAQSTPWSTAGMSPLQTQLYLKGIGQTKDPIQGQLDYSKLSALPNASDYTADAQKAADTVYAQAASRLNPQWQQSDSDLKSSLAAQGISENSDAYTRAQQNQGMAKNDAYNQAIYSAQQAGQAAQLQGYQEALSSRQQGQSEANDLGQFANTAQGQEFGQMAQRTAVANQNAQAQSAFMNQARQQQIQEAAYARELPINEISTLLNGGQVSDPSFSQFAQVGVASPDLMGMTNNNYNQAMSQYNQQQANKASGLGSIFGAAGSLGSAAIMMSDRRFKENVRRIGTLANGLATYAFNYVWSKAQEFGVMAQEALDVVPEAVGFLPSGAMYVDYGKVY